MAALSLMLVAWDRGLGSCWIGFAGFVADAPEIKEELNVPEEYELIAPIILGYPARVRLEVSEKNPASQPLKAVSTIVKQISTHSYMILNILVTLT